jgi:AraC-like DNA-binding protein
MHIIAVDCCEHVIAALKGVPASQLTLVHSGASPDLHRSDIPPALIVIGVPRYPLRRLFISDLRRVYTDVPVLILRRLEADNGLENHLRGEFILGESSSGDSDLDIVGRLRKVLPIQACSHVSRPTNYELVRDVIRFVHENYSNPDLEVDDVAKELRIPKSQLSRVLNQEVGISFRQLLRNMRMEEAKRLLASQKFSIKRVALTVGFSDSHYFARSFKEFTGLSASEYRAQDAIFG